MEFSYSSTQPPLPACSPGAVVLPAEKGLLRVQGTKMEFIALGYPFYISYCD